MKRLALSAAVLVLGASLGRAETLDFNLRSREEVSSAPGKFEVINRPAHWDPHKTAVVICDMWDQHWCKSATARVAEMAPRMNRVVGKLRDRGAFIVHCPSETMHFYENDPGRKMAIAAPLPQKPAQGLAVREGFFPIDAGDGGCDDVPPCPQRYPWRREIATLEIKAGDAIDDSSRIISLLRQRGIENVIVMGVHTNMCILNRPFGIRSLVRQGMHVALMRDMTDAMYNPARAPRVDHFTGVDLVVEFIEKYWCPTLTSDQVLGGEPFRFAADHRGVEAVAVSNSAVAPLANLPCTAEEEQKLRAAYESYRNAAADYRHAGPAAIDRWMDWKWGLRIHWGLYTMFDGYESWIIRDHINDKEWQKNYYASYTRFNPTKFDADQWMEIMKRGGMNYFSFTSKHHEGFCMWPTKTLQKGFRKRADGGYEEVVDHYSIAETPFHRDIVGELVKAGRSHGLGVSLYYSHIDWHDWDFGWDNQNGCRNFWYDGTFKHKSDDPRRWAAFIQKERDQITELLTRYGPIDTLCLDMNWCAEAQQDAYEVAKMVRRLQPNVMLRNRGIGDYGDYETPEGTIPEDPTQVNRPWQVIYPCGTGFSYKSHDQYKSKQWVLESLIDIVSKGGNFQIGFGPRPDGTWPPEMIQRLEYVGDWLKINGESIYATRPYRRWHDGKDIRFTRSKDGKYVLRDLPEMAGRQVPNETRGAQTGIGRADARCGRGLEMAPYREGWARGRDSRLVGCTQAVRTSVRI